MKYYAGIGSREAPKDLKPLIYKIVNELNELGYILRSGGAVGADSFFETNAIETEIILPWKGYNDNQSPLYDLDTKESWKLAEKYHPNWNALPTSVKKLMSRNGNQVLGLDLKTPVEFIVCWTKDGKASGGTGQALRIAKAYNIPVFNLYHENAYRELHQFVNQFSLF